MGLCADGMGWVWDGGYVRIGLVMALAFGVGCSECESCVYLTGLLSALREVGAVYAMV